MQAKNSDVEELCVEGEGKAEVCFEDEEESASSKVRALCNHPPPVHAHFDVILFIHTSIQPYIHTYPPPPYMHTLM